MTAKKCTKKRDALAELLFLLFSLLLFWRSRRRRRRGILKSLFGDSAPAPPSERRQTRYVTSKMAARSAAVTNKEISQIIKQAVPEIHEEGDEIRCGSFNG